MYNATKVKENADWMLLPVSFYAGSTCWKLLPVSFYAGSACWMLLPVSFYADSAGAVYVCICSVPTPFHDYISKSWLLYNISFDINIITCS